MSRNAANPDCRVAIAIMTKAPVPGQVKTRLIPHLGAEGAARLQRWLLWRTVATALQADVGPVSLWCAPDTNHPDFAACQALGPLTLQRQPPGDLGVRMLTALAAPPAGPAMVIGTDCPALSPLLLRVAAEKLSDGNDAVLIPAEDGGYVLIGMNHVSPVPFADIEWSTDRVAQQTRCRLSDLGWRWFEPATLWDVDRVEDYERLCRLFPQASCF